MRIADRIELLDPVGLQALVPAELVPDAVIHILEAIDVARRRVRADGLLKGRHAQLSQMDATVEFRKAVEQLVDLQHVARRIVKLHADRLVLDARRLQIFDRGVRHEIALPGRAPLRAAVGGVLAEHEAGVDDSVDRGIRVMHRLDAQLRHLRLLLLCQIVGVAPVVVLVDRVVIMDPAAEMVDRAVDRAVDLTRDRAVLPFQAVRPLRHAGSVRPPERMALGRDAGSLKGVLQRVEIGKVGLSVLLLKISKVERKRRIIENGVEILLHAGKPCILRRRRAVAAPSGAAVEGIAEAARAEEQIALAGLFDARVRALDRRHLACPQGASERKEIVGVRLIRAAVRHGKQGLCIAQKRLALDRRLELAAREHLSTAQTRLAAASWMKSTSASAL